MRYEKFDVGLYVNLMIKNYDFDRVVSFVNFVWLKSIDFTGVLEISKLLIDVFLWIISLLNIMFSVEFEEMLYFQWFEGIFCGILMIFYDVKSSEMLDFSGFARSGYRSDFWLFLGDFEFLSRCMDGTDSPVFAVEHLF